MAEIYKITLTTTDGEVFSGTMSRREPQLVNGFIGVATGDGGWAYVAPQSVSRITAVPVQQEEEITPENEA